MIPDVKKLTPFEVKHYTQAAGVFEPYRRDEKTLSRPWVKPGTPGLEHRIGGLEKAENTGNVSYDPQNHDRMVHLRVEKIERVADTVPDAEVFGDAQGDVLVLGWGGTIGPIRMAVDAFQKKGKKVSSCHLRYINPFPKNLGGILKGFKKVLIPEGNLGQLRMIIRAKFLVDAVGLNQVTGKLYKISDIEEAIQEIL